MDSVDMLDVLHFYFEDDLTATSQEEITAKSESRSVIYGTLYGTPYKYKASTSGSSSQMNASGSSMDGLVPFDPSNDVTKPFVPATDFDAESPLPFGQTLDAPLGY
jgi:hypothetical protein